MFELSRYNQNSLYILNNGYFLDPKSLPGENNRIFFQIKSPEGAILEINNPIFTLGTQADNSVIVKESVEAIIGALSIELSFEGLTLQEIVQKQEPPPIPKNGIFKIIGKIVDKDNTPLQNVKVEPFLLELPPPTSNPQEETITTNFQVLPSAAIINPDKIPFTDDNGNFEYTYEQGTEIDFDKSYVTCTKSDYFSKQIGPKLLKTGEESIKEKEPNSTTNESVVYDIYDLGKITLESTEVNLDKVNAKVDKEVQEAENIQIELAGKASVPFEVRLAMLFQKQKENLKRTLFPAIIALLAKFGPQVLNNIISGMQDPFKDKVCPSPEEIKALIKKRNQLVRQLNNIYKIVRIITKVLKITNALVLGLKIAFQIAKFVPAARPTLLIADAGAVIKKRLETAGIAVTILTVIAVVIGATLAAVISLLESLDFLIQECSEEINPETGEPNVSFVEINDELNNFIDPSTGAASNIIDPLTGNPLPYKGFTFEIKDDTSQNFKYPKRYAVARNIQGVQVLRSESSFASNPQILIEELKFVIDRDDLRAD